MKKSVLFLLLGTASILSAQCNDRSGNYTQGSQDQRNYYNQNGGYSQKQFNQNGVNSANTHGGNGVAQTDRQLASKIQDSLRSSVSNKYNNVNVSVNKGNVTLTGTVASQDDLKDLEANVRDMSGVQNVNNQVQVRNS